MAYFSQCYQRLLDKKLFGHDGYIINLFNRIFARKYYITMVKRKQENALIKMVDVS